MTGRERKSFSALYAQNKQKSENRRFVKALAKTPANAEWVFLQVIGNKDMVALSHRGWEIISHAGSGYGQPANHYMMRRNRVALVAELSPDENVT